HYLRSHTDTFANRGHRIHTLEGGGVGLVAIVAGSQAELLPSFVVLPDGAASGPRDLVSPHDDRLEHGLQIEGRAKGTADLPECRQLVHRTSQLSGAALTH